MPLPGCWWRAGRRRPSSPGCGSSRAGRWSRSNPREDALHRELREELGIGVRLGTELQAESAAGWPLNAKASMRVWFAEIADGEPRPLEDHDELRWISLAESEEALTLPWIPADFPIVRALLAAVAGSERVPLES